MLAFLAQTRAFLSQQMVHREYWLQVLIEVVFPVSIPMLVWLALLQQKSQIGEFNAESIRQYYFLVTIISTLSFTKIHVDLSEMVHMGTLNQWLLRPVNFWNTTSSLMFARMISLLAPTVAIILFFLVIDPNLISLFHETTLLNTFALLPLAIILACCMNAFVGLIAFWFIEIEGIYAGIILAFGFFSGMVLPASFLPLQMQKIGEWLPFHYVFTAPISIIMDSEGHAALPIILGQLSWIGGLCVAIAIAWRLGLRRFDAVGA